MRNFDSRMELTGDLFEEEALGPPINTGSPEYQKAYKEYIAAVDEAAKKGRYAYDNAKLEEAFKLLKKCQGIHDPTNPQYYLGQALRIAIQDVLKLEPSEYDRVKFYTARGKPIKTPLDKLGIDSFIEYEEIDGKIYRCKYDLTVNPHKPDIEDIDYKSDIIISANDLPNPNLKGKEFMKKIEEYAKRSVQKMAISEVQGKKIFIP